MKPLLYLCSALALSPFIAAATGPIPAAMYTFESLSVGQTTPLLNLSPDSGPANFQASFTSTPNPIAFGIGTVIVNPSFSGQNLMDTSSPGSSDALTITLNTPVTAIQFDFALSVPGYLELVTDTATISAYTPPQSQAGSLSLSSSGSSFTSFELLGFDANNQPTMLAIDNLSLTPVPEPGAPILFLLALGLYSARQRLARC